VARDLAQELQRPLRIYMSKPPFHAIRRGRTTFAANAAGASRTKRKDQTSLNPVSGRSWLADLALGILLVATPAMASVSISQPAQRATVTSPVQFSATSKTTTCAKGVAAMGVYVDNKLVYVVYEDKLSVKLHFKDGEYGTVVEEWDRCGGATYTKRAITVTSTQPPPPAYAVDLSWEAPESSAVPIVGYNVYRSTSGSSASELLNSSIDADTAYLDSTVQSGQTYDYTVVSVDSSGVESPPSSIVILTIP